MGESSVNFAKASSTALQDPQLRANFRRAMDGLMSKRAVQFADSKEWHAMRALGASVRLRALSKLPELLEKLEANCTKNGIQVHWASTTDEANAIVDRNVDIADRRAFGRAALAWEPAFAPLRLAFAGEMCARGGRIGAVHAARDETSLAATVGARF